MNQNHWRLLIDEINEKQVVGDLGIYMHLANVYLQDKYEFLGAEDHRIDDLMLRHGLQEAWRQDVWAPQRHGQRHVDDGGTLPVCLMSTLYGEVCGYRDKTVLDGLAVPVRVEFKIQRVGRRLLTTQEIVAIKQNGGVRPWNEYEDLDDGGMTFDGHD